MHSEMTNSGVCTEEKLALRSECMVTHVVQMRELDLDRRGQETGVGLHDNRDHLGVQKSGVAKEKKSTQSDF